MQTSRLLFLHASLLEQSLAFCHLRLHLGLDIVDDGMLLLVLLDILARHSLDSLLARLSFGSDWPDSHLRGRSDRADTCICQITVVFLDRRSGAPPLEANIFGRRYLNFVCELAHSLPIDANIELRNDLWQFLSI